MSDDIETLRAEIERLSNRLEWEKRCHKVASEKLVPVESDRDRLQGRVATLQKALDDRFAADKRAAKAIFTATGRKWGFPANTEVVAFLVAEVERLEKEGREARIAEHQTFMDAASINVENDSLRAKLERAKEDFGFLLDRLSEYDPDEVNPSRDFYGHVSPAISRAKAVLSELSADAPAQQTQRDVITRDRDIILQAIAEYDAWMLDDDYDATTALHNIVKRMRERALLGEAQPTQIGDEVREAMVEAEKAIGAIVKRFGQDLEDAEMLAREYEDKVLKDDDTADRIYAWALHVTWGELRRARAALAKLRSVMK